MKRFRKEPETDEKLTERSFMRSIAVCVLSMILCMSFLASTTWAWYTGTVTSAENVITISSFQIDVKVEKGSTTGEVIPSTDGFYSLPAGTYTVTLKAIGPASTGYCKIVVGEGTNQSTYYTQTLHYPAVTTDVSAQTSGEGNETTGEESTTTTGEEITITLKLETADPDPVKVKFIPCWGMYSGEALTHKSTLTIPAETETSGSQQSSAESTGG